ASCQTERSTAELSLSRAAPASAHVAPSPRLAAPATGHTPGICPSGGGRNVTGLASGHPYRGGAPPRDSGASTTLAHFIRILGQQGGLRLLRRGIRGRGRGRRKLGHDGIRQQATRIGVALCRCPPGGGE